MNKYILIATIAIFIIFTQLKIYDLSKRVRVLEGQRVVHQYELTILTRRFIELNELHYPSRSTGDKNE